MAVAEARAAWQRTANRCFVQEDAKRAPKLACCPPTSSSSKQLDVGPVGSADGQDKTTHGFVLLKRNPSHSNLSPDSRWWLQMQPNHGYERGLTNEQLSTPEAEKETFRIGYPKNPQESPKVEDAKEESFELIEMDSVGCMVSKQANDLCFDSESSWLGGEKTEVWWRTADRDELASFVAQRSVDHIENCDLPQPQNTQVKRDPYAHIRCFDREDNIFTSSIDWKPRNVGCPNPTVHTWNKFNSGSACGKKWASVERQSVPGTDKPISDCTTHKVSTEIHISESDPGKAQLLEALRHSQTRAREAEKAAKQAYEEKEHIVKLFFRQASHLFAYKQWFQLLQLENIYFQIKNDEDQPISSLFQAVLPLVSHRVRKVRKKATKGKRAKRGHPRYDISKYAAIFALGLSLVGAGVLLGWTVGWMLPAL